MITLSSILREDWFLKSLSGKMVFRLVPLIGGPGPIAVTGPGPNGELYLADQNGVIMTYLSGTTTIFLDLRSQIPPLNPDYDERGLLYFFEWSQCPRRDRPSNSLARSTSTVGEEWLSVPTVTST